MGFKSLYSYGAAPDTITNIKHTKCYSINHINESFLHQAHQCSVKYSPKVNEFKATGLTERDEDGIIAPFVKEALVSYEIELVEIVPIHYNNTFFVISRLKSVFLDLSKVGSIVSIGLDGYAKTEMIKRLPCAKP